MRVSRCARALHGLSGAGLRRCDAAALAAVDRLAAAHRQRHCVAARLRERATAGALGGGVLAGGLVLSLGLAVTGSGNAVNQASTAAGPRLFGYGLLGLGEAALLGALWPPAGCARAVGRAAPARWAGAALLAALALAPRVAVRLAAAGAFFAGAMAGALIGCAVALASECARPGAGRGAAPGRLGPWPRQGPPPRAVSPAARASAGRVRREHGAPQLADLPGG